MELQSEYKIKSQRVLQMKMEKCVRSAREPGGVESSQSVPVNGKYSIVTVKVGDGGIWALSVHMHATANRGQTSPYSPT